MGGVSTRRSKKASVYDRDTLNKATMPTETAHIFSFSKKK